MRGTALLAALLGTGFPASAAPSLHPLFSDHAVLQRGRPISIWGTADPREKVTVRFGGRQASATASADGSWRVSLPALEAGGPHELVVTGTNSAQASARDVLVGDVFLCSGQSNMELQVSRALNGPSEIASANDQGLRILTVPQAAPVTPAAEFGAPVGWAAASPQSVGNFSAACYFMARELRSSQKVPIGAVSANWGGTQIKSWMDPEAGLRAAPRDAELLALFARDPAAAYRRFAPTWERWWRSQAGNAPWESDDGLAWKPVPAIQPWEGWGDPALSNYNGMVWLRREVMLTAAEAAGEGALSLGVLDEIDQTWVNGQPVGNSFGWSNPRDYRLPAGTLKAGRNVILLNVYDSWGFGGFHGPAERLRLRLGNGEVRALGADWTYSAVPPGISEPPRPPWHSNAGLSLIHNGMIAPLGNFGFAGVAWYQGESDVMVHGSYAQRLSAMIDGWRRQFGRADLPFLIVSLANFGEPARAPTASGTAALREQQRRAVESDRHAALVQAVDLGERLDIHPTNKQEVGRRLARAARVLVYGANERLGPRPVSARRDGGDVVLEFDGVTEALATWSGVQAIGFELCAETQDSCRFVAASASSSTVRLVGDGRPATRVRHAWADHPVINLYDAAPLPAGTFEIPID